VNHNDRPTRRNEGTAVCPLTTRESGSASPFSFSCRGAETTGDVLDALADLLIDLETEANPQRSADLGVEAERDNPGSQPGGLLEGSEYPRR